MNLFTKKLKTTLTSVKDRDILSLVATSGHGGIGRRARFRSVWANPRGGSSPLDRIICTEKPSIHFEGFFVVSMCITFA